MGASVWVGSEQASEVDRHEVLYVPRGARWLLAVAVGLVVMAGATYAGFWASDFASEAWHQLWWMFDVGREFNIPAWYSSSLWLVLGALAVLGVVLTRRRASWATMAAVCFLAGLDEYAELHERLDVVGLRVLQLVGVELWFTWVVVGLPLAVVVVLALVPLLVSLPRGQARLLAAGGVVFLLGAVVVETLSGMVLAHFGGNITWHYVLVTLVEEALELTGLGIAVGAVAGLYRWRVGPDGLRVRPREGRWTARGSVRAGRGGRRVRSATG